MALSSTTKPIDPLNSLERIEFCLVTLTGAIIAYDDIGRIDLSMSYHSTHILLCLIAPLAPSFAEECWVVLHYDKSLLFHGDDVDVDMIESELADEEELQDLPRGGRLQTLSSIFDQPLPIPRAE